MYPATRSDVLLSSRSYLDLVMIPLSAQVPFLLQERMYVAMPFPSRRNQDEINLVRAWMQRAAWVVPERLDGTCRRI